MREQFEKLPEIANVLENEDTEWSDRTRRYVGYDADFANGAWYAFQDQQNKIDLIKEKINMVYNACEDNEMVANLLDEMEGLLK